MKLSLLILSFMMFFSSTVNANNPLKIMTIELPPYAYEEDGKVKGFAADIVRMSLDKMNIKYKIMIQPWARSLLAMKQGSIDGLFPMFKTDERLVFTLYPKKPLVFQYTSLFKRRGDSIQFDGHYPTLSKYRICTVRGFSSGPGFDQAVKEKSLPYIDMAESSLQNMQKMLINRCQVLVDDKIVVLSLLKKMNKTGELQPFADIDKSASFLGFSKKTTHQQQVNAFNHMFDQMLSEGVIEKTLKRYVSN